MSNTLLLLVSSVALLLVGSGGVAPEPGLPAPRVCAGGVDLPVFVHVSFPDGQRRGSPLRARVEVTAQDGLEAVRVRLVRPGGARVDGPRAFDLGRIPGGSSAQAEFPVVLPARGNRFLLEFEVVAESAAGRIVRGATFNALPDGPADPGRTETTPEGRRLRVYAVERIDR